MQQRNRFAISCLIFTVLVLSWINGGGLKSSDDPPSPIYGTSQETKADILALILVISGMLLVSWVGGFLFSMLVGEVRTLFWKGQEDDNPDAPE